MRRINRNKLNENREKTIDGEMNHQRISELFIDLKYHYILLEVRT